MYHRVKTMEKRAVFNCSFHNLSELACHQDQLLGPFLLTVLLNNMSPSAATPLKCYTRFSCSQKTNQSSNFSGETWRGNNHCRPSHTNLLFYYLFCCAELSRLHQQWNCSRVGPMSDPSHWQVDCSDDSGLQPTSNKHQCSVFNSCLCRKPKRKTLFKVCVFSSQDFCSFKQNRISFSHCVCTLCCDFCCVYCRARPDVMEKKNLNVWCCPSAWEAAICVPNSEDVRQFNFDAVLKYF